LRGDSTRSRQKGSNARLWDRVFQGQLVAFQPKGTCRSGAKEQMRGNKKLDGGQSQGAQGGRSKDHNPPTGERRPSGQGNRGLIGIWTHNRAVFKYQWGGGKKVDRNRRWRCEGRTVPKVIGQSGTNRGREKAAQRKRPYSLQGTRFKKDGVKGCWQKRNT